MHINVFLAKHREKVVDWRRFHFHLFKMIENNKSEGNDFKKKILFLCALLITLVKELLFLDISTGKLMKNFLIISLKDALYFIINALL